MIYLYKWRIVKDMYLREGVPDFGALTGEAAIETEKEGTSVSFTYDGTEAAGAALDPYTALLFDAGYTFVGPLTMNMSGVDFGLDTYTNGTYNVFVGAGTDGVDTVIVVSISDVAE